jgi:SAM-dependent methyltransferase
MTGETEWLQSFFQEPWLQIQRRAWTQEQTQAHVDTIVELLALPPEARILDAPCGEGRIAIELAARGYHVTGLDINESLLADARRRAEERKLRITWEQGDMREPRWREEFDAAICWWGSFGYFDERGNRAQAESAAHALEPGRKYLIDTHVADSLLPQFQPRGWQRVGDIFLLEERRWDFATGRAEVDWTFISQGVAHTVHSSIRVYTYRELCDLLLSSGFSACDGYDAQTRQSFAFGSRRLIMVATR